LHWKFAGGDQFHFELSHFIAIGISYLKNQALIIAFSSPQVHGIIHELGETIIILFTGEDICHMQYRFRSAQETTR